MPKRIVKLEQNHYGSLEIDTRDEYAVKIRYIFSEIPIERENLEWVIEILKSELKKG